MKNVFSQCDRRLPVRPDYLAFGKPNFSAGEIEALARVMRSGWIGQGEETLAFERELAAAVGAAQLVTVNSCTSALFLVLRALGVGRGDEVIVPSLTWCSTANAALYLEAGVVFCDVDRNTLCATAESVARCVTPRTKVVVPVHMGGLAADVSAMRASIPATVAIVEDAAHALGATYADGKLVGNSANPVCFSFYANKNLSTGEGGAIATGKSELADTLRSLRLHALPADAWRRFTNPNVTFSGGIEQLGYKMNFTDLNACIGRVQLQRFAELQERRRLIAEAYSRRLIRAEIGSLQAGLVEAGHARHLCVLVLAPEALARAGLTRDGLLGHLRGVNIGASVHYYPLHTMPLYRQSQTGSLPVTESLAPLLLTLPISSSMMVADADYVCDHLLAALGV